jgi:uracil phosphoribosyltransferase
LAVASLHVSTHPLVLQRLCILRDVATPPPLFRAAVADLAMLLAIEATADLPLTETSVTTPMGIARGSALVQRIALVPILRAGLGMVESTLRLLPNAQVWHLGAYRDHASLQPVMYYNHLPQHPELDLCLVLDPMLATGGSAVAAVDALRSHGIPQIKFIGLIGAPEGVHTLATAHPDVPIHLAALDEHLTPPPLLADDPPEGYIVPGLGDAGDRQFGTG